jgi:hypothetical protein
MRFMLTLHNGCAAALQRREFECEGHVFRIGEIPLARPALILLKDRVRVTDLLALTAHKM